MTLEPVDAYIVRLERELRKRGIEDTRIVEEAREHLVDAVECGRLRGLSLEDAEREAFERFGAPETIAAHVAPERARMMNRFAEALDTVWHRKWWILAPTILTAVVTSVASYYFLPTRYRSESVIRIVSPRLLGESVRPTGTDRSPARFQQVSQSILSHTRLERIIRDFDLYQGEQKRAPLSDVVLKMRRDINLNLVTSDDAHNNDVVGFTVSFVSSDPQMALKITERLATFLIDENLREKEKQAEGTSQFIDSQISELRRRLIAYEKTLDNLRAQNGRRPLSRADILPYEVLQERYKALLIESEQSRIASSLEHRQIGEQFQIIDPARLPERPVGPSRLGVNVAGAFAGLVLGLVVVGVRGRSKKTSG